MFLTLADGENAGSLIDQEPMTDTSSIGPGWPPAESSCRRIKGIDTRGVVRDRERLDALLQTIEKLEAALRPGSCDRLSLRALFDEGLLEKEIGALERWVEAVMPLDDGTDRCVVYLGHNGPSRPGDEADLERALGHVEIAQQRGPVLVQSMLDRVRDGGYSLRILSRQERLGDEAVLDSVANLYRRFGWDREETRQILANASSLIAVASTASPSGGGEQIVCSGIAELSHLRLDDGDELRMAEFTEAATRAAHQGHGLYSAVAATLMLEIAALSRRGELLGGELDLGFGECSGHDIGVLIAARRLGRRFALVTQRRRGWPFPGYLAQHVPIAGAPRSTRYNDLFPTYFSREALYRFAES